MAKDKKKKLKVQTADRRIKEHQSGGSRWMKVPSGTNSFNPKEAKAIRIAVIPYEVTEKGNPHADPGVGYYERTAWVHYDIGPNRGSYPCNAKNFNKKCPVCEYRANMMKKGGDEEQIKSLAPKERQLWNVVDRKNEDKGVQLWEVSFHNFGKFLDNTIKEADPEDRESALMFADPDEGSDIRATPISKPAGGGRNYNEFSGIQLIPRTKPLPQEWLDAAMNLDKMVEEVDYDELKKAFLQTEDEADDEDDDKEDSDEDEEDDKPASRNGKAKPKVEEDEEEEEDEEDDDEDPSAEDMGLEVGMTVTHKKWGTCKVTKISGDGTSVRVKDKGGKGEERNGIAPKDLKVVKVSLDDEDDEDDEPAPKKPAGKKPAAKDDDDDDEPLDDADDDEEEDGDDDDDDDEPVKKPAAKKPAAKKVEEDDDDEDDDDEPAPVKRGRGRPPGSKSKK